MFTCISCRVAFEDASEQRNHFSTDWHRYNMKRRVANLPPVVADAFNEKVIERREQNAVRTDPRGMNCESCSKSFATENAYRSHVQSKKHREREYLNAKSQSSRVDHAEPDRKQPPAESANEPDGDDSDDDAGTDDSDIEERLATSRRRRFLPTDCLFCGTSSTSVAASLQHMSSLHSFFVPDRDALVDLPGLLSYLGEKVVVGNICLYCPGGIKEFNTVEAARRHMIDKGHCRIAFETDEDRAELADFYGFDVVDDDEEWEDVDGGEEGHLGHESAGNPSAVTLADDGLSLILPSGRVLGHRALRVYYAQKFRPVNEGMGTADLSVSKIARVKERLADPSLALVPAAGGAGGFGRGLEVMKARNAGEAKWARKQAQSFQDQRARESHKTKMGFKHNSQKHFRDPLLQ